MLVNLKAEKFMMRVRTRLSLGHESRDPNVLEKTFVLVDVNGPVIHN